MPTTGFVLEDKQGALGFSSDTGPTERFWEIVNGLKHLRAIITETSFPKELQELANASGHLTPATLHQEGPPGLAHVLGLRMLYPASGRWEISSSFDRDNRPTAVQRANIAFRAALVPAGRHRVVQVYRPWSVPVGFTVSTLGLVAAVGIALATRGGDR